MLLAEATTYDGPRIGETLAPGGEAVLEALGCLERFRAQGFVESHGTEAAWGSVDVHDNEFLLSARGSGWHLDRARFDALLADRAEAAGAQVLRGARLVGAARDGSGWHLRLRRAGGERLLDANFVIDASGQHACVAVRQGARRRREDRLAGVSVLYRFPGQASPGEGGTLVEASMDGWWYSAVLPDRRVLVTWMSDTDLIASARIRDPKAWRMQLARSGPTAVRVAGGCAEGPPRVWAAASRHMSMVQGDGWAAAGDAACVWDPLSSCGILKALRTGRLAAFVALDWAAGRADEAGRYTILLRREHAAYLHARGWFYRQEGRWPGAPFWMRRHTSPIG